MNAKTIKQSAFDVFVFTVTVGIWGFVIAVDVTQWVMP